MRVDPLASTTPTFVDMQTQRNSTETPASFAGMQESTLHGHVKIVQVIQLTVGMVKDEKIHKRGGNDE